MKKFDNELAALQQRLSEMGDLAQAMVGLVAAAVKDRTRDVHAEMSESERRINKMQTEIDQEAIRMLTVYGPVAKDLRYVLVCTHVTAKMERMGDQAINICQALELMHTDPATHPPLPTVRRMADLVCEMVNDALDAYFSKDVDKAVATRVRDDVVDALNEQVMKELLTDEVLREVLSGATDIGDAVAQILIARYLERIADQATNICKEVVYLVRGDDVRHIRPPRDEEETKQP
jgi:phosphate transport system protein